MPRIKLQKLTHYIFSTPFRVGTADINYGGHTGNDRFLIFAQEARLQWLNDLGYDNEISLEGAGMIVTDAAIVFKSESFYGDKLTIYLSLEDFNKYGFDIHYEVFKGNQLIAQIKTGVVMLDYTARKVTPIPGKFLEKVNSLQKHPLKHD